MSRYTGIYSPCGHWYKNIEPITTIHTGITIVMHKMIVHPTGRSKISAQ